MVDVALSAPLPPLPFFRALAATPCTLQLGPPRQRHLPPPPMPRAPAPPDRATPPPPRRTDEEVDCAVPRLTVAKSAAHLILLSPRLLLDCRRRALRCGEDLELGLQTGALRCGRRASSVVEDHATSHGR
jgi:hypothetical protein